MREAFALLSGHPRILLPATLLAALCMALGACVLQVFFSLGLVWQLLLWVALACLCVVALCACTAGLLGLIQAPTEGRKAFFTALRRYLHIGMLTFGMLAFLAALAAGFVFLGVWVSALGISRNNDYDRELQQLLFTNALTHPDIEMTATFWGLIALCGGCFLLLLPRWVLWLPAAVGRGLSSRLARRESWAALKRGYPRVLLRVVLLAAAYVLIGWLADALYAFANRCALGDVPRVQYIQFLFLPLQGLAWAVFWALTMQDFAKPEETKRKKKRATT